MGKIRGPYKYGTNKQYHYQWNVSGVDVIRTLNILFPYLSKVKQKQAFDNIQIYHNYLEKRHEK